MGGSGDNVTQTTTSQPWSGAEDFAKEIVGPGGAGPNLLDYYMNLAQNNNGALWWTGQRVADPTANQQAAWNQAGMAPGFAQAAINPFANSLYGNVNPATDTALQNQMTEAFNKVYEPTISGQYLDPSTNKYLQSYANAATQPLTDAWTQSQAPAINAAAISSGRYGSDAWGNMMSQGQNNLLKQIGNTQANIYEPAYQQERQLQMSAAGQPQSAYGQQKQIELQSMPQVTNFLNDIFKSIGIEGTAGEAQQGYQQKLLDAAQQQFQDSIWSPYNIIAGLGNIAFTGGKAGGTQTTQIPSFAPSFGQQLMSAAGTGAGMYGLTGNPLMGLLGGGMSMM